MKESSIFNARRSTFFSDSVLCLGKILENPQSNDAWEQRLGRLKSSSKYRNFDRIDGEPMEFQWNISQDSIRCSSVKKSKRSLLRLNETPENFTRRNIFMSMFNDIFLWNKRRWKRVSGKRQTRISVREKIWKKDNGHVLVLVLRKSGYSISEDSPQGVWDNMAERMLLEFAKSGCPIFRATTPLSRGQL